MCIKCVLRSLWKYLKPSKIMTVLNNMLSLNDAPNYFTRFYFWWMQDGAAQSGTPGYNGSTVPWGTAWYITEGNTL